MSRLTDVDDLAGGLVMGPPSAEVFDYWIWAVGGLVGSVYGRRMYEVMRYWDENHAEWSEPLWRFAGAMCHLPKDYRIHVTIR